MPLKPDRSKKLRSGLAQVERIANEAQANLTKLDDALTATEDRERRRSQRTANNHSDRYPAFRGRS